MAVKTAVSGPCHLSHLLFPLEPSKDPPEGKYAAAVLINCHLSPYKHNAPRRLEQAAKAMEVAGQLAPDARIILAGDMNMVGLRG